MPTVNDIAKSLERWAPRGSALSYDNVGLQVGDARMEVQSCLIALDLTPAVLQEAKEKECEMIITHHPLIFRPLKQITSQTWHGHLVLELAKANIALYSIHTNLDLARDGVSFELARALGLEEIRFLRASKDMLLKLVTFAPVSHESSIREALAEAGAGRIGLYTHCAFSSKGTGFFKASADAQPFAGTAGGALDSVEELRIEVQLAEWQVQTVVKALKEAHPYEEVAYDLYQIQQPDTQTGMGAIGSLPEPVKPEDFLQRVCDTLSAHNLRYVPTNQALVQHIAVCGGSGSDLIPDALAAKADALVTADLTYHQYFDVLNNTGSARMMLIDAGHYETEALTITLLKQFLSEQFASMHWHQTEHWTSPVQTFIPRPKLGS